MAGPAAPVPPERCVFCRIASGAEAAHLVVEEADVLAFLDVRPLFPGHCLVVPRAHHADLSALPADALAGYFAVVQRLATVIPGALGAAGTFVAVNNVVSQSVPHLHTHVVPRRPKDGLRGFFWPRTRYAEGEAERTAAQLRAAYCGPRST